MKRKVVRFVNGIVAVARDVWSAAENSGFCCGIRLDCKTCERMPTASSCCGVRI